MDRPKFLAGTELNELAAGLDDRDVAGRKVEGIAGLEHERPGPRLHDPEPDENGLGADAIRLLASEGLAGMGSDGMVIEALRAGAAGSVSALANLRPNLLVRLKRAHLGGEARQAEDAQRRSCVFGPSFWAVSASPIVSVEVGDDQQLWRRHLDQRRSRALVPDVAAAGLE